MKTILVICTGNVCRSPVVAALLKNRLASHNLDHWVIHSAGTQVNSSVPASVFSVEVIAEVENIDISPHRSKPVSAEMVDEADLILCMAARHTTALNQAFPSGSQKIVLLSEMSNETRFDVVDPFGKDKTAYQNMVQTVTEMVDSGLPRIIGFVKSAA